MNATAIAWTGRVEMCCRYYVDENAFSTLGQSWGWDPGDTSYKKESSHESAFLSPDRREIHPGDISRVLVAGEGDRVVCRQLIWGFTLENGRNAGSSLIINARSESALEKRTFRDAVLYRRCAVPATGFYEWNRAKEKAAFEDPAGHLLYLAGFFQVQREASRFVILTTEANDSVRSVHERMPLLLKQDQVADWLHKKTQIEAILGQRPHELHKKMDFEQQSFSFGNWTADTPENCR